MTVTVVVSIVETEPTRVGWQRCRCAALLLVLLVVIGHAIVVVVTR